MESLVQMVQMEQNDAGENGTRPGELSRRAVLLVTVGAGVAYMQPLAAQAAEDYSPQFLEAYRRLTGDVEPRNGPVKLDLPELAENGNMVPFSIAVDSPMDADSHVKTLTILSTGNPQPVIATFHFSQASGRASVSGRLRLARTQDVIAVAELNTGERIKGATNVKVTIGGCGAG